MRGGGGDTVMYRYALLGERSEPYTGVFNRDFA